MPADLHLVSPTHAPPTHNNNHNTQNAITTHARGVPFILGAALQRLKVEVRQAADQQLQLGGREEGQRRARAHLRAGRRGVGPGGRAPGSRGLSASAASAGGLRHCGCPLACIPAASQPKGGSLQNNNNKKITRMKPLRKAVNWRATDEPSRHSVYSWTYSCSGAQRAWFQRFQCRQCAAVGAPCRAARRPPSDPRAYHPHLPVVVGDGDV